MARPREFDLEAALDRALDVFWTNGYEATSVDDLCQVTGLSRSSLYSAFGGKRNLLLKSVDRYVDRRTPAVAAILAQPLTIHDAIAAFLDEVIAQIIEGTGRRGCFLGNCAAELPRSDRTAMGRVRLGLSRMEATFREALERARSRGELAEDTDIDALARFIAAGTQGLRLIGKANPDRAVLDDIARILLRCLDPVAVHPRPNETREETRP